MEKKLDGNYSRMVRAVLNEATSKQTAAVQPPTETIKGRRTRQTGHCWRSKDELINDVLLWNPSQRRTKVERPARIYIQQLFADTGYILEDLPGTIDDRDGWQKRVREIRASSATWWCWMFFLSISEKIMPCNKSWMRYTNFCNLQTNKHPNWFYGMLKLIVLFNDEVILSFIFKQLYCFRLPDIRMMVRVFANAPSHTKDSKNGTWYLFA